jgi:1,4-dihydroxy-2-naphthoyl-CoA synthase
MNDTATRFRPAGLEWNSFRAQHFLWRLDGKVATITLNRPERKNPLTLESYAELRDTFRNLLYADSVKAVVVTGAGGNFCSGGDVHEIIGPLVEMQRNGDMAGLLAFTRMTGDLVKAMRACPQPIVAAIDGVCAGAGAILAMASDCAMARPEVKLPSCSCGSGLPAPIWAPATCCRVLSAPDEPPSCSIPDGRWMERKRSVGAFTASCVNPKR